MHRNSQFQEQFAPRFWLRTASQSPFSSRPEVPAAACRNEGFISVCLLSLSFSNVYLLFIFICGWIVREHCEDGGELSFDHGAPCFALNASNSELQSLVNNWESRGLVAQWKEKFGCFDFSSRSFVSVDEVSSGFQC